MQIGSAKDSFHWKQTAFLHAWELFDSYSAEYCDSIDNFISLTGWIYRLSNFIKWIALHSVNSVSIFSMLVSVQNLNGKQWHSHKHHYTYVCQSNILKVMVQAWQAYKKKIVATVLSKKNISPYIKTAFVIYGEAVASTKTEQSIAPWKKNWTYQIQRIIISSATRWAVDIQMAITVGKVYWIYYTHSIDNKTDSSKCENECIVYSLHCTHYTRCAYCIWSFYGIRFRYLSIPIYGSYRSMENFRENWNEMEWITLNWVHSNCWIFACDGCWSYSNFSHGASNHMDMSSHIFINHPQHSAHNEQFAYRLIIWLLDLVISVIFLFSSEESLISIELIILTAAHFHIWTHESKKQIARIHGEAVFDLIAIGL